MGSHVIKLKAYIVNLPPHLSQHGESRGKMEGVHRESTTTSQPMWSISSESLNKNGNALNAKFFTPDTDTQNRHRKDLEKKQALSIISPLVLLITWAANRNSSDRMLGMISGLPVKPCKETGISSVPYTHCIAR
ncbi:hypothetical protein ElyMa_006246100 [Elysia marginata]|uniref:Uncharacterized protein n=1 Tax=Elysia marginata TaxID=1093978 RepID=A0AAV4HBW6_9GAST|nr:hypothetical protein ElyMa_006246100 [Elysia marginata]